MLQKAKGLLDSGEIHLRSSENEAGRPGNCSKPNQRVFRHRLLPSFEFLAIERMKCVSECDMAIVLNFGKGVKGYRPPSHTSKLQGFVN